MNRKAKSILSAVITGGLLMTYGGVVLATNSDSTTTTTTPTKQTHVGPGGQGPMLMENDSEQMKTMLAALVTDGTLTQADVDSITAFIATEETERKAEQAKMAAMTDTERKAYHDDDKATTPPAPKADMFSRMVTSGILTQEQVDSIKAKNEAQRLATHQAEQTTHLKALVASNIISDAQVEKILAYEVTQDAERKAEMTKEQAMTKDERDAYHKTAKATPKAPMAGLVEAGIITQAQADSIKAQDEAQRLATRQAEQTTRLNTLVASNTITDAQVEKIIAYEATQDAVRKAEMAKEQAMTTEERDANHKTTKGTPIAPMSGLVDEGILTQAEADAVAKVMGPHKISNGQN